MLSNMVKTLLDADRISLFLYNEDTNELCALLDNMCEIRIPVGNGIAGAVFTSGKMINSRDPYSDSRFLSDVDKQTGYKTSSILCMPIILSNGRVSGVIEVLNKRSRTKPGQRVFFTKQDETTLDHVCRLSGNLLERIPECVSESFFLFFFFFFFFVFLALHCASGTCTRYKYRRMAACLAVAIPPRASNAPPTLEEPLATSATSGIPFRSSTSRYCMLLAAC